MDKDFLTELVKRNWPTAVLLVIFWFVYQDFTQTNRLLTQEIISNNRATIERYDNSIDKLDKSIGQLTEALNRLEARQTTIELKIDTIQQKKR
ncbi:hypothetical protein IKS86_04480 [bacterium]|nr:hypothetical protein [bacterium]